MADKYAMSGAYVGTEICEALGIDPEGVRRVILDCETGKPARVIVHAYAMNDGKLLQPLKVELQRYELRRSK